MAKKALKQIRPRPLVLIMLEGWGIAPSGEGNLIAQATTPFFDHLISHYPTAALAASGEAIGLSAHVSGGSEVGHTVIGSGSQWFDQASDIGRRISNGSFSIAPGLIKLKELIKSGTKRIHLIGLISNAETESSFSQLEALIDLLSAETSVTFFIHAVLDGREVLATAGQRLIAELSKQLKKKKNGRIASLIGRLYAFDEKHNSSRIDKAFKLYSEGVGKSGTTPEEAISEAYSNKIFDEEFPATIFSPEEENKIADTDLVIFWNHSGQTAAPLVRRFLSERPTVSLITLTDYGFADTVQVLFPKLENSPSLTKILADAGLKQLRLGDSAGFPGVGFYLDGATHISFENLDRKLVPWSANLDPVEASTATIQETKRLFIEAVHEGSYDFIAVTFSQADVLAHQQNELGVKTAIETVDGALRLMIEAVETAGGASFIVGTHGFAERLHDPATGVSLRTHSLNPVPLYIVGKRFEGFNLGWPEAVGGDLHNLKVIGSLADLAPTLLGLSGLTIPPDMTGRNLAS